MKYLIALLLFVVSAMADSTNFYYTDYDWAGTQSGTEAEPWKTINWTVINAVLATNHVYIYFSAKDAGTATTDDIYGPTNTYAIDMTLRTVVTNKFIIFDGATKWNTNDATPLWYNNSYTNRSCIDHIISTSAVLEKKSYIILYGFHVYINNASHGIVVGGDNWYVISNQVKHIIQSGGAFTGIHVAATADGPHEGSTYPIPASSNIWIVGNEILKTIGEHMYIGAGGSRSGGGFPPGGETWAQCGYPSHQAVYIIQNKIHETAWINQGDGIDIKGGVRSCIVESNEIYNISADGIRGIVVQGQETGTSGASLIIRNNYIHDVTTDANGKGAIVCADTWGVVQGVQIYNNIIVGLGGSMGGIFFSGSQDQSLVANNIIADCPGAAIYQGRSDNYAPYTGSIKTRNNLVWDTAVCGLQSGAVSDSDYNYFTNATWGFTTGPHDTQISPAQLAAAVTDLANTNYHHTLNGVLRQVGQVQAEFSMDFDGLNRGAPWDVGPYQYTNTPIPYYPLVRQINAGTLNVGTMRRP